ncbi:MAG TPA: uracil-DNA glycosylase [Terriglobales bacterium]|nr:uracil-DNA glycosylase [Terriglobales bacterium]
MSRILDPQTRCALAERLRYYNELGIYDFYRREIPQTEQNPEAAQYEQEASEPMTPKRAQIAPASNHHNQVATLAQNPEFTTSDPARALQLIREDLGDCTRCVLHKQGRKQIVFGVGNPDAELMFIGEAPGADEDQQGEPFVGRAGQLLTNMIKAMGLSREQVYIANIIKCRPPNNRTPERDECETCSPFLMRQVAAIKPKVIVALGAVAARTLLALNESMSNLRGRWYEFRPTGVISNDPGWTGAKLAVTYHPAFLLRDPRQKKETWKDLQMVMKELGLPLPTKAAE